jgi:hypothetical protein
LLDADNVDFREAFLIKGGKTPRSSDKKQSDTPKKKTPSSSSSSISNTPTPNSSGSPPISPLSSPRGWTRIPLKERDRIPRHASGSSLIDSQSNLVLGINQFIIKHVEVKIKIYSFNHFRSSTVFTSTQCQWRYQSCSPRVTTSSQKGFQQQN